MNWVWKCQLVLSFSVALGLHFLLIHMETDAQKTCEAVTFTSDIFVRQLVIVWDVLPYSCLSTFPPTWCVDYFQTLLTVAFDWRVEVRFTDQRASLPWCWASPLLLLFHKPQNSNTLIFLTMYHIRLCWIGEPVLQAQLNLVKYFLESFFKLWKIGFQPRNMWQMCQRGN